MGEVFPTFSVLVKFIASDIVLGIDELASETYFKFLPQAFTSFCMTRHLVNYELHCHSFSLKDEGVSSY